MDAARKEQLEKAGVDTREAISRFAGNEGLYERFLYKFLEDKTFLRLTDALERKDWEGYFTGTHTLKGVAGNLGMTRLYEACGAVNRLIREERIPEAADMYGEVKAAYGQVAEALGQAEKG